LGVSTYSWTPQGRKLEVSVHREHEWIDAYRLHRRICLEIIFCWQYHTLSENCIDICGLENTILL